MQKKVVRKSVSKRNVRSKKKSTFWSGLKIRVLLGIGIFFFILLNVYHYRNGLAYYLGFKSNKTLVNKEAKRIYDVRNFELLKKYNDKVVGIDVSQYQGKINWEQVKLVENTFSISYVLIRATAGSNKVDNQFKDNWHESRQNGFLRGAYHYYRPNENSIQQANNFIATVQLQKGDLPPVLDIEKLPRNQSIDNLKLGLRRWLEKVHHHYKIKPIIYTGEKYYNDFLKEEFNDYSFWIANYNFFVENMQDDWLFWQFTEKATVAGINGNVDVNLYNGTPKMLEYLTVN